MKTNVPRRQVLIQIERTGSLTWPWEAQVAGHLIIGWTEASVKRQARRHLRRQIKAIPRHDVNVEL